MLMAQPMMRMKMQRMLVLLVGCLLAGRVARAQEAGQDPRVGEAKTACVAGDVQKGVRLLAELYTASSDPIWIFNQGRCYQQNDQLTQALSRFKEFLRKSQSAPTEDVRDAQKYMAEIEAELQRTQQAAAKDTANAENSKSSPEPGGTVSTARGATAAETKPGRGLRYAGVSAMVAGGAALATGVVFSLLVNKTEKDIESLTNNPNGTTWSALNSKYSDGSRYETLQWISYGVGAAAAIAGAVLYWVGSPPAEPKESTTSAIHVFPLLMADGAGAGVHLTF